MIFKRTFCYRKKRLDLVNFRPFLLIILFLQAKFGALIKDGASTDFNPYFGTDYGICSIIKPQTAFDPKLGKIFTVDGPNFRQNQINC